MNDPIGTWDEFDLLLGRIRSGNVVPVVGAELLTVTDADGRAIHLHDWIGRELAAPLGLGTAPARTGFSLNDLTEAFLRLPDKRRVQLYRRVHQALSGAQFTPPRALQQLAEISDFPLILSTTFDDLLFQAVRNAPHPLASGARQLAFSPRQANDLDPSWQRTTQQAPLVYHLFGRMSVEPDYAICDEDVLEFLVAMHADHQSPRRLFDVVRGSNLLFIGCDFPDWLSRFFLRTLKRTRLSAERDQMEVVADTVVIADARLASFLQRFSYQTYVYPGDGAAFVDALHQRWLASAPAAAPVPMAPATPERPARPLGRATGCVFISYAAEDRAAAIRMRDVLVDSGIDVWMDTQRLDAGAAYDRVIEDAIRECVLFVPIISRATEARDEGYFRREWRLADERTHRLGNRRRFIVPVTIDGIAASASDTPASFRELTWGKAPGGAPGELVLADIREAYRAMRRAESA